MTNLKHGTIVPLIGGFPMGAELALGKIPEWIVTYPDFSYNDSFYLRDIKRRGFDIPKYMLNGDESPNQEFIWEEKEIEKKEKDKTIYQKETVKKPVSHKIPGVDIVTATPPCAGLSMLNSSVGKSGSSRGSDAEQNKWIYRTADYVLEKIQPKVMITENAPGAYTNLGRGVIDNLRETARKYNYGLTLIKTSTILHGLPQKRDRCFIFFWQGGKTPLLKGLPNKKQTFKEYFSTQKIKNHNFTLETDYQYSVNRVKGDPYYRYLSQEGGLTLDDMRKQPEKTMLGLMFWNNPISGNDYNQNIKNFENWLKKNYPNEMENEKSWESKSLRFLYHVKKKHEDNKGVWDASLLLFHPDTHTNAVMGKTVDSIVHPIEERILTTRELAYMMGMPLHFNVNDLPRGVIGQNVPTYTARDMVTIAKLFALGKLDKTEYGFMKFNNISKRIDYVNKS